MKLKEGIWLVRHISNGQHYKYYGEFSSLETMATYFEPYRNRIYMKLIEHEVIEEGYVNLTAKQILNIISSCIKKGETDE